MLFWPGIIIGVLLLWAILDALHWLMIYPGLEMEILRILSGVDKIRGRDLREKKLRDAGYHVGAVRFYHLMATLEEQNYVEAWNEREYITGWNEDEEVSFETRARWYRLKQKGRRRHTEKMMEVLRRAARSLIPFPQPT